MISGLIKSNYHIHCLKHFLWWESFCSILPLAWERSSIFHWIFFIKAMAHNKCNVSWWKTNKLHQLESYLLHATEHLSQTVVLHKESRWSHMERCPGGLRDQVYCYTVPFSPAFFSCSLPCILYVLVLIQIWYGCMFPVNS